MNKTIYTARLVKDFDLHYSTGENAKAMATFDIAVPRNFKNAEGKYEADFFRCKAFGNRAEFLHKFFHKGDFMILEGNWRNDNYTKDGVKVYQNTFFVDNVEFGGGKNNGETPQTPQSNNEFMNIPDNAEEELPF